MRKQRGWMMRFDGLFQKQRQDRELDAEIESYQQLGPKRSIRTPTAPASFTVRARIHYLPLAVLAFIAWFDLRSTHAAPDRPLAEERPPE